MAAIFEPQVFLFLSQILGKNIIDSNGHTVGKIVDLVANLAEPYPPVTSVLFKSNTGKAPSLIAWHQITEIQDHLLAHLLLPEDFREPSLSDDELLLKDTLLDKQIVDTNGAKVRRVNDLQFLKARKGLHLVHVDVGFRGLMRRVGMEKAMDAFLHGLFDYSLPDQFISWKFVQPLVSPDLLRLKITQNRLAQLHPADLADIIEELDINQRTAVFQSLDVETAAETLEETDPKIQVSLIEDLDAAEASDIIEEMSLSDATDLLQDLPKDTAEDILKEMEQESAEDIIELLAHPEETAGGLMTTAFLSFTPSVTTGETIKAIRDGAEDMDLIYYVYVTDEDSHLLGVISLRDLLVTEPETRLSDIMDTRVVAVNLDEEKDKIASHFVKYGMIAIPVVDKENRIKGTIIFKNLLEIIAPHLGQ
ncbi:MAG: CBS domain-containing protein [Deltaproteobacteria bacterium]|nr:CBS domain-containing protein [Deltaproteobacteria bacterium]